MSRFSDNVVVSGEILASMYMTYDIYVPAWMEARAADCSASMRSLRRLGVGAEEAVEAWLGPPPCRKSVTADCGEDGGRGVVDKFSDVIVMEVK